MEKHKISIRHAWNGVVWAFRTQPNIRVHGLAGVGVMLLGLVLGLERLEWVIILGGIFLLISVEMINTAMESMTDLISKEYSEQAKVAKDVSAGMVLMSAILAVIVGLLIFLPKVI